MLILKIHKYWIQLNKLHKYQYTVNNKNNKNNKNKMYSNNHKYNTLILQYINKLLNLNLSNVLIKYKILKILYFRIILDKFLIIYLINLIKLFSIPCQC